ncbi:MAG: tandem-95 repeat protein [Myxococcota bacterium]
MLRSTINFFIALGLTLLGQSASAQTTLTVTGKGSTIVLQFPANGGYTQDRGDTLEDAAQFWADRLESTVDIEVAVSFTSLGCTATSAVLGSAGARSVHQNFTNAPAIDTLYSAALANSLAGVDLNTSSQSSFPEDILARFNSDLDDPNLPNCLGGADWHYGTTAATSPDVPLYQVALHELAHGLGFQTFANFSTGQLAGFTGNPALFGTDDQYVIFLRDAANNRDLDSAGATDAQRQSAGTGGDIVWTGSGVNGAATGLTSGLNNARVEMYAPATFAAGSSISHFDITLSPDELMEPRRTPTFDSDLSAELLYEIGWVEANETPVITGQSALSVDEDTSITLGLGDLTVSDPDNAYPADFTLDVETGPNYSVSGTTVTPDADFDGSLTVPVTVNDGVQDSAPFDVIITVNPINDPPVLAGQQPLSTDEDVATTLSSSDLLIQDPDDTSFTLTLQSGANYSFMGAVVTPDANFVGTLVVPVTVSDGDLSSNSFDVNIEVVAVNDPPSITGQRALSVPEDTAFTYAIGDVIFTDVDDSSGFAIRVLAGTGYALSGNTITPDTNFFGNLTVPVVVSDGTDDSLPFDTVLTVTPVNDPPVITAQSPLRTDEDTPITVRVNDFTVVDPDDTSFTLRLTMLSNASEVSGVVTPAPDFEGVVTAMATVNDGALDSAPFPVSITVDAVNDPPVITGTAPLSTDEDTPLLIEASDLTIVDPDSQSFAVTVLSGTNYTANAATLTPNPNFSGNLQVNLQVDDGQANSSPFMAMLTVNPVNDAPVVTGQSDISLPEDDRRTILIDDLVVSDVDDDLAQLDVILLPGNDYTFSGSELIPDPDFAGMLSVALQVSDGVDASETFVATVDVTPVDDAPVITGQRILNAVEDEAFELSLDDLEFGDVDGEGDFVLLVEMGADYSAVGTTVRPGPDFFGLLQVQVRVDDGALRSDAFLLEVDVTPVNDAPLITGQDVIGTFQDAPVTIRIDDLMVSDVDDVFPDDFSLRLDAPVDGNLDGLVFTPALGFTGLAELTAVVNDGEADSPPFTVVIAVAEPTLDARIELESVGLFTPLPQLDVPDALGLVPNGQVELREAPELLRPGRSFIQWREFNQAGDEAFFEQQIDVRPLIDFARSPVVQAGEEGRFDVWLNGFSPEALELPFAVRGAEDSTDLENGVLSFDAETLSVSLSFQSFADPATPTEILTIETSFGTEEIPILQGSNSPPRIELSVEQDGRVGFVVLADGGPVRFSAAVLDAESPSIPLVWSFPPSVNVTEDGADRLADPSSLETGLVVAVRATDEGGATTVRRVPLRVLPSAPPSQPDDLDGDEIEEESLVSDEDQDGLVDALDPWTLPHVMPMGLEMANGRLSPDVVEAEAGTRLVLGELAQRAGGEGAGLSAPELALQGRADVRFPVDAYVDVVLTDLARTGQDVQLVIPLRAPLGADPVVLRTFQSSAWFDFAGPGLASAPADASCPPPESSAYVDGLQPGARCLRVRVRDGGSNDGDGAANREITLLAGILEAERVPDGMVDPIDDPGPIAGTDGECSCRETRTSSGWWILPIFGLAFGLRRRLSVVPVGRATSQRR